MNKLIISLYYLSIFLFSFGQLGRISINNQEINFYLYEISLILLLLLLVFKYKITPFQILFSKFKYWIFFIGWLMVTFILSLGSFNLIQNFVALLYLFRFIFYFVLVIYLGYSFKERILIKKDFNQGLLFFILFTVITSVLQYFLLPDLINLVYLGWDQHLYRLFGVFFDTSVAGAIYGLLLLLIILDNKIILNQLLKNVLIFILFIFCLLTFSRSLYLVLFIISLLYFISQRKFIIFFSVIFIAIFIIAILPKPRGEGVNLTRMFSINSRITDYQNAYSIWINNPIMGIGYNHIRYEKEKDLLVNKIQKYPSHSISSFSSSFMMILVTSGIIGLVLFSLSLVQMMRINIVINYLIVFLGLLSFTDNILLHPFILFLLFLCGGYYSSLE